VDPGPRAEAEVKKGTPKDKLLASIKTDDTVNVPVHSGLPRSPDPFYAHFKKSKSRTVVDFLSLSPTLDLVEASTRSLCFV
jgi:hypothetical protein